MVSSPVLVLNQNYQPLNVCTTRRAVVLLDRGKAEVLEHNGGHIHTPTSMLPIPSVIRLVYMIKRPRPVVKLTRREVFIRDNYMCQYCGKETKDLTLDHVVPRHRGGPHVWENLVSACKPCNHRKAGRTPAEAKMKLFRLPEAPRSAGFYIFYQYLQTQYEWQKFIPEWERAQGWA
ncbi:MAG: HNH endonuclease [Chloroflexi bacterium]|nr:HNH endonuclease [Chloroflexota bacterium]